MLFRSVYTNVMSALYKSKLHISCSNFIAGLGGKDISDLDIIDMFNCIQNGAENIQFIGVAGGDL